MKNTLKTIALIGGLLTGYHLHSQTNDGKSFCGTETPDQQWEENLQRLISLNSNKANKTQAITTIPVIIHMVHGGEAVGVYPNLAQGQLNSQIQVLNEDFGGIGFNSGAYPASAFAHWADTVGIVAASRDGLGRIKIANTGIQFCLATKDTAGNTLPEPGIHRVNYNTFTVTPANANKNPASYGSSASFKNYIDNFVKPQTIWNVTKYLNIWVTDGNLAGTSLLGYATFPYLPISVSSSLSITQASSGNATKDGFWCYAQAFGSAAAFPTGFYNQGNDKGRTATHEIGHWVGLRHVWGDAGQCNGTDFCKDTPKSQGGTSQIAGANFGCPQYPLYPGSCTDNAAGGIANIDGDIFMNFMDYSDDPCKYMFTQDQANRIQTVMANGYYRKFLGTHNLCSLEEIPTTAKFNMPAVVCGTSAVVSLTNTSQGVPVPTFTWSASGGATFSPNINSHAATLSFPATGNYTVTLTTNNGTTSTVTKTINVVPYPTLVISSPGFPICSGSTLTMTASGANFFAWQPSNKTGTTVTYLPAASQVYTVVGTGTGNCKTTQIISVEVVDCYAGLNDPSVGTSIQAYPNPMRDKLMISAGNNSDLESMDVLLLDITGKLILKQQITFSKDRKVEIDTREVESGIYLLKLKPQKGTEQLLKVIKE